MPRLKDKVFNTFNDGTLSICEVEGRKITKTKYAGIRFGNRVVGIKRFWHAKVNSSTVDKTVAIPWGLVINTLNIVIINDRQYKILQIQEKFDARPAEKLLSLEESKILFTDGRSESWA